MEPLVFLSLSNDCKLDNNYDTILINRRGELSTSSDLVELNSSWIKKPAFSSSYWSVFLIHVLGQGKNRGLDCRLLHNFMKITIRRVSINSLVRVHRPPLFEIEKPDNCESGGAALS